MVKVLTLFLTFFLSISYFYDATIVPKEEKNINEIFQEKEKMNESLLFVGDIMLGRYVETILIKESAKYLFSSIEETLLSSTYVIANLEGPLPLQHNQTASGGFRFNFPEEAGEALSNYHISSVSLANNHTFDAGIKGYNETRKTLANLSIAHFGASSYFRPEFVTNEIDGVILSTFGINLITPNFDEESTLLSVKKLCNDYKKNTFIAFIHAGEEYTHKQSGKQVSFSHRLLDETCVHTIIGSHPHVVEGIEKYKNKFIFYSLGNFIFDQYFSKETQEGLLVRLQIQDNKITYTLLPIVEEFSSPSLAGEKDKEKILTDIANASSLEIRDGILSGFLSE